jgi:quercetin dioxygenase-like cupin family protein
MAKTMLKTKQPLKLATGKKAPAASRAPRKSSRGRGPQRFVVSHPNEADFKVGLRTYAKYRDLGISQATGGLAQAHVIRFVPPFRAEEVSQLHYHDVEFQMIYVLKGWIRSEFDGQGAHTMHAGACWIQPPRIEHKVLGYSDDCEVLEIILPAEFETVTLD